MLYSWYVLYISVHNTQQIMVFFSVVFRIPLLCSIHLFSFKLHPKNNIVAWLVMCYFLKEEKFGLYLLSEYKAK